MHRKSLMPIALKSLDIVVVGRFNPYIINPPWLCRMGICKAKEAEGEVRVEIPGGRAVFHFQMDGLRWQVTDACLMVSTDSVGRPPGERVAQIIEKLPHTPISAVGHNIHYHCDIEAWKGGLPRIGDLDSRGVVAFGKPRQLSWSCALELADLLFNMKLEQHESSLQIDTNLHREASEVERVVEIAKRFRDDLELSSRLIGSIAKDEVATDD